MGLAKNAVLGLGFVAYALVVAGVVLQNLPLSTLAADPPVAGLAVPTVGFLVFAVALEVLL